MLFQCAERWQGVGFSFVKDEGTARLMDILLFGPLLIATGALVPNLPKPLRATLIAAGTFVIAWNGAGYLAGRNEALRAESFKALRTNGLRQGISVSPEGPPKAELDAGPPLTERDVFPERKEDVA